jgi:hypothetical protein
MLTKGGNKYKFLSKTYKKVITNAQFERLV